MMIAFCILSAITTIIQTIGLAIILRDTIKYGKELEELLGDEK